MVLDLRSDMFDHAQKLSLAFDDTESKGILMYRINNQAAAMGQIDVQLPVARRTSHGHRHGLYLVRINPLLAPFALGMTPLSSTRPSSTPSASSRASTACEVWGR